MGMQTYIFPSSRNISAINLTICDPTIYIDFSWQVYEDTFGSDHFPILWNNTKNTGKKHPIGNQTKLTGKILKENAKKN